MSESLGRHIVLGMAGHIDHGKTEIVKALTGTDTDRLKEEKERGMTTDLGFAFLGDDITIIDVPGHEKFVKTMVAGVNTVDLALLVIAADDSIMPQTTEHLEILSLLQVPAGLVAVSKIDLVEPDWVELVSEDIKKLIKGTPLEGNPVVPVSPITGQGMDALKNEIFAVAQKVHARQDKGVFRLPIDRVFTIKGFGTVVAGTILSGKVSPEDTVELLPQEKTIRVRGVQVHDHSVEQSTVGFRTAINLIGTEKETVERGDVLAEPGFFRPASMMDAYFSLLRTSTKELKNRARIRVHVGTSEVIARIILLDKQEYIAGDKGFVQLHFEKPVVADRGDRYVVRSYSPIRTIGGGVILDTHPVKHKQFEKEPLEKLQRLLDGDPAQAVLEHLIRARFQSVTAEDLAKSIGINPKDLDQQLQRLDDEGSILKVSGKRWMSRVNHDSLEKKIITVVTSFHEENPLRAHMTRADLRSQIKQTIDKFLFDTIITNLHEKGSIIADGDRIQLKGHSATLKPELESLREQIEKKYLSEPNTPPTMKQIVDELGKESEKVIAFLLESGKLVRLEGEILFHRKALDNAKEQIRNYFQKNKEATVSDIRQHLNTSRKYAIPLLSYLDGTGFTERDGDIRRLRE